jgi:GNAT superfamily N-acetyltransferase
MNTCLRRVAIRTDDDLDRCEGDKHAALPDEILLGGVRLWLRALEPVDRDALAAFFARLSARSLTQRFLGPKKQLTEQELARFSDVDHLNREALLAIDPRDGSIIAVAHYSAWPGRNGVAEVAGAALDAWQSRGIGSQLLALLIERARASKIATRPPAL